MDQRTQHRYVYIIDKYTQHQALPNFSTLCPFLYSLWPFGILYATPHTLVTFLISLDTDCTVVGGGATGTLEESTRRNMYTVVNWNSRILSTVELGGKRLVKHIQGWWKKNKYPWQTSKDGVYKNIIQKLEIQKLLRDTIYWAVRCCKSIKVKCQSLGTVRSFVEMCKNSQVQRKCCQFQICVSKINPATRVRCSISKYPLILK